MQPFQSQFRLSGTPGGIQRRHNSTAFLLAVGRGYRRYLRYWQGSDYRPVLCYIFKHSCPYGSRSRHFWHFHYFNSWGYHIQHHSIIQRPASSAGLVFRNPFRFRWTFRYVFRCGLPEICAGKCYPGNSGTDCFCDFPKLYFTVFPIIKRPAEKTAGRFHWGQL